MKHTTLTRILALLLALTFIGLMFVGCARTQEPTDTETSSAADTTTAPSTTAPAEETSEKGFCTIVIEGDPATEYRVNLDKVTGMNGLLAVLEYLKTEKSLTYVAESGFLTEVGDIKQDTSAGVYIYLYTSVVKDQDVSEYKTEQAYGDMTLVSAGVGAKDMTIENGAVIYIGTISW